MSQSATASLPRHKLLRIIGSALAIALYCTALYLPALGLDDEGSRQDVEPGYGALLVGLFVPPFCFLAILANLLFLVGLCSLALGRFRIATAAGGIGVLFAVLSIVAFTLFVGGPKLFIGSWLWIASLVCLFGTAASATRDRVSGVRQTS